MIWITFIHTNICKDWNCRTVIAWACVAVYPNCYFQYLLGNTKCDDETKSEECCMKFHYFFFLNKKVNSDTLYCMMMRKIFIYLGVDLPFFHKKEIGGEIILLKAFAVTLSYSGSTSNCAALIWDTVRTPFSWWCCSNRGIFLFIVMYGIRLNSSKHNEKKSGIFHLHTKYFSTIKYPTSYVSPSIHKERNR